MSDDKPNPPPADDLAPDGGVTKRPPPPEATVLSRSDAPTALITVPVGDLLVAHEALRAVKTGALLPNDDADASGDKAALAGSPVVKTPVATFSPFAKDAADPASVDAATGEAAAESKIAKTEDEKHADTLPPAARKETRQTTKKAAPVRDDLDDEDDEDEDEEPSPPPRRVVKKAAAVVPAKKVVVRNDADEDEDDEDDEDEDEAPPRKSRGPATGRGSSSAPPPRERRPVAAARTSVPARRRRVRRAPAVRRPAIFYVGLAAVGLLLVGFHGGLFKLFATADAGWDWPPADAEKHETPPVQLVGYAGIILCIYAFVKIGSMNEIDPDENPWTPPSALKRKKRRATAR